MSDDFRVPSASPKSPATIGKRKRTTMNSQAAEQALWLPNIEQLDESSLAKFVEETAAAAEAAAAVASATETDNIPHQDLNSSENDDDDEEEDTNYDDTNYDDPAVKSEQHVKVEISSSDFMQNNQSIKQQKQHSLVRRRGIIQSSIKRLKSIKEDGAIIGGVTAADHQQSKTVDKYPCTTITEQSNEPRDRSWMELYYRHHVIRRKLAMLATMLPRQTPVAAEEPSASASAGKVTLTDRRKSESSNSGASGISSPSPHSSPASVPAFPSLLPGSGESVIPLQQQPQPNESLASKKSDAIADLQQQQQKQSPPHHLYSLSTAPSEINSELEQLFKNHLSATTRGDLQSYRPAGIDLLKMLQLWAISYYQDLIDEQERRELQRTSPISSNSTLISISNTTSNTTSNANTATSATIPKTRNDCNLLPLNHGIKPSVAGGKVDESTLAEFSSSDASNSEDDSDDDSEGDYMPNNT